MKIDLSPYFRAASVAKVAKRRDIDSNITSRFGGFAMGMPNEKIPLFKGKEMYPLLQIRLDEVPYKPSIFEKVAFLVVYMNVDDLPFDTPNGEGWLVKEYQSLDDLTVLKSEKNMLVESGLISWRGIDNDLPGYDDFYDLLDEEGVNHDMDENEIENYIKNCANNYGTKVGGYPSNLQGELGVKDFVFQIDGEEKINWGWGGDGIVYFFRNEQGDYRFEWQGL